MFEKVLVVEDFDVVNGLIRFVLQEIKIKQIDSTSYCDQAFHKIKNAHLNNEPFDLIISDLSFINDGTPQILESGEELIEEIRKEFPNLKIIVFTVEDKAFRIQHLYYNLKIQAYVWKNRNGLKELKNAIHSVFELDMFYISPDLSNAIHPKKTIEVTDFDIFLIQSLSKGLLQGAISEKLKVKGMVPSSISAIEKRLKILREHFDAKNPTHLVAIAKDLGLI